MINVNNISDREYWKNLIELQNNKEYSEEIEPAHAFFNNVVLRDKYKFVALKRNKNINTFPDFFLHLEENKLINLEVTILSVELVKQTNAFLKKLENILTPLVEKNKDKLPPGSYDIFCFPTSHGPTDIEGLRAYIPDFKYRISDKELKKNLEQSITEWFKRYSINSSNDDSSVCNRNGDLVLELYIRKTGKSKEVSISLSPKRQKFFWRWVTREELENKLQEIIDKKEDKYIKQYDGKYDGVSWLLISDMENIINPANLKFNVSEFTFKLKFFKKVFLIYSDSRFDELNAYS